jgi:hypothetical protein
MSEEIDWSNAEILPNLQDYFRPEDGKALPEDLIGATVVGRGTVAEEGVAEGGGLVIDYRPPRSRTTKRVVFSFNELGMWVIYSGERTEP